MLSIRRGFLLFWSLLLLLGLACNLSFGKPAEVISTAESAARGAAETAQTAVAQAGDLAGTAVALATSEGSAAIATVQAMATPYAERLKEKLESIEPDAEGNVQIALTEQEVNNVLRLRQLLSGDLLGAGIQSQQVTFSNGTITLEGTILEPLPGRLTVIMTPTVVDGQLNLNVQEASAAGQVAPQESLDAAEAAIRDTIGQALEYLPANIRLTEIVVDNGEFLIIGRSNQIE